MDTAPACAQCYELADEVDELRAQMNVLGGQLNETQLVLASKEEQLEEALDTKQQVLHINQQVIWDRLL